MLNTLRQYLYQNETVCFILAAAIVAIGGIWFIFDPGTFVLVVIYGAIAYGITVLLYLLIRELVEKMTSAKDKTTITLITSIFAVITVLLLGFPWITLRIIVVGMLLGLVGVIITILV